MWDLIFIIYALKLKENNMIIAKGKKRLDINVVNRIFYHFLLIKYLVNT